MDDKTAILEDLRLHAYLDRVLPDVREHKIRKAIEVGCSRREIATAYGISRQALDRFLRRRNG